MREVRGREHVPLAMGAQEFRTLGHQLIDDIAGLLDTMPDRRVTPAASPQELRALLGENTPLPEAGADAGVLLDTAARMLFENSTFNAHPRFFGYITAGAAPIGILGDLLAAGVNANCGAWTLSPMATEIEAQTIRWLAQLIGYPADCSGLLVSGGNVANFTCFLAARTAAADWNVREDGLAHGSARQLTIYASPETHTWIQKAADLFGMGTSAIRWIPTAADLRMDVRALRTALAHDRRAGHMPLLVVGTGGSVSTGAVDPLREIAAICREHDVWFHVDGAYGGFAAAVADIYDDAAPLADLGLADSVAIDPHKWLYAPLEAGCALVRDTDALRHAFAYHPPYFHFGVEANNYVDMGMQNSRGFRALKVWLGLRHAGRDGYRRMISDDIALARRLHDSVAAHPELEPISTGLSITTFRYVPPELRSRIGEPDAEAQLNRINEELLDRLQKAGAAFVSNAVVHGRYVLRACIVNFNTTTADVDALPDIVVRTAREMQELSAGSAH